MSQIQESPEPTRKPSKVNEKPLIIQGGSSYQPSISFDVPKPKKLK